jgi:hypothetical protein
MSIKNSQNTFLEGIKADFSPLDASSNAATDILNGTLISDKKDQMTLQSIKSNAPIPTSGESKTITEDLGFIVDDVEYVLEHPSDITKIRYKVDFGDYEFKHFHVKLYDEDRNLTYANYLKTIVKNTWVDLSIDVKKSFKYLVIDGKQVDNKRYSLEVQYEYQQQGKVVKLPKSNQIFGLATHNNISYILSGKKTNVKFYRKEANNKAPKPIIPIGNEEPLIISISRLFLLIKVGAEPILTNSASPL